MPIPQYQTYMRSILENLVDGKERHVRDITDAVCDDFNFTEEQRNLKIPSGKGTYASGRIGWAKTYLVQADLVTQPRRAHCLITERGLQALNSNKDINNDYLKQFPEFTAFQQRSNKSNELAETIVVKGKVTDNQPPYELIENTVNLFNNTLANELLQVILNATPRFFENLVVDLMLAMGYGGSRKDAGQATQYTQDGGIDGIIKEDKLGLDMIYLQAKRYTDKSVGRPEIQAFAGALDMHRAKKGVFITTSNFSKEALQYTSLIEKRIVLINGEQLTDLMLEYNLGVSTKHIFEIKALDSDYFLEE